MLITLHNWQDKKGKFLPKLKSKGLLRHAIMRVWNRDGSFRIGHIFEYKDENAYKNCQPIWQEIEKQEKSKVPIKIWQHGGGGCQKSGKIADVIYGWSQYGV